MGIVSEGAPRRRVQITFECDVCDDGTPMWAPGHPEDVIRRNFINVTDLQVEVSSVAQDSAVPDDAD